MPKLKKKRETPQHLFNLKPEEISLVDEGANGKRIIITKRRKQPMANTPRRQQKVTQQRVAEEQVKKRLAKMPESVRAKIEKGVNTLAARRAKVRKDLMGDEDETADAGAPLSDAAQAALKASARIMQPYADEITQGDLDYVGDMLGMEGPDDEMAPEDGPPIDEDIDMAAGEDNASDDEGDDKDKPSDKEDDGDDIDMALDDPESDEEQENIDDDESGEEDDDPGSMDDDEPQNDDAPDANIAVPNEPPPGVDDEDHAAAAAAAREAYASTLDTAGYKVAKNRRVTKRAPREPMSGNLKAVLARIEKRAARNEKAIGELTRINKSLGVRNAKLEKDLAVERDSRVSREYERRAEKDFSHLGDKTKIAKALRTAREKGGEEAEAELEAIFKASAERIQKQKEYGGDLFSEVGSSRSGEGADNGEAKIESMAAEIIQKAVGTEGKKPSRSQVYREVLKSKEGRKEYARSRAGR